MARRVFTVLVARAAAIMVVLLGLLALLVLSGLGGRLLRDVALRELGRAVDGSVRVGAVRGSLWRTVEVRDIEFDDADGRLVLAASRVRASFSLVDLVRGRYAFRGVWLSRPTVRLEQDSAGRWNVERLFRVGGTDTTPAGSRPLVDLRDLRVTDGALVVRPHGRDARVLRLSGVELDLRRLRASHPDSTASVAEVRHVSFRLADPALRVTRGWGHLLVDRDSIRVALDALELPGSVLSLHGVVRTGGPRTAFELSANAERFRFEDFAALSPALPATGGGALRLRVQQRADGTSAWTIRGADVWSHNSRVRGSLDIALGERGGARIGALDITAAPLDLALLAPLVDSLPLRGEVRGRVRGSGPLSALDVQVDLAFTDAAAPGRPTSTILGRGRLAFGGAERFAFRRFALGRADLSLATIERIVPAVDLHGRVLAEGTLDGPWRDAAFEGTLTHSDGGGPASTARGSARLTLADTVRLVADLALDSLSFDDLARTYTGIPLRGAVAGRVRLEGPVTALALLADVAGPAGRVQARGTVGALDAAASIQVRGRFDRLDVAPHFAWAPPTSLAGTFATDLIVPTLDTLAPATGNVRVALDRSKAAGVTLSRAGLALTLGAETIRLDTLYADHPGGRLDAVGAIGRPGSPPGQITFVLGVDTLGSFAPLARWLRTQAGDTTGGPMGLDGDGQLVGGISGTTERWELRGELHLASVGYGSFRAVAFHAEGAYGSIEGGPRLRASIEAESLAAGGFSSGRLRLTAAGPLESVAVRVEAGLPLESSVRAVLVAAADSAHLRVRLDSVQLDLPSGTWALVRPAHLVATLDSVVVDSVVLRSGSGGIVRADGSLPVRGVGDFRLAVDSVPVRDVYALVQRDTTGVGGWLSISARLAGSAATPEVEAYVSLADGRFGEFHTALVDGLFNYGDQLLTFKGALWRGAVRVLGASGSLPLDLALTAVEHRQLPGPLELRVRADSADLSAVDAFTTLVTGVRGTLTADLGVRGTWDRPALSGRAVVTAGALTLPSLSQRWEGITLRIETQGDTIHLAEARIRSGGTLDVGGDVVLEDLTRPVLHLALDARGFQALNRRDFAGLTGTGRLRLEGPFLGARLTGALTVDEGFLAFADLVEKRIVNLDDPEFRAVVDSNLVRAAELGPSVENVFLDSLRIDGLAVTMGPSVWLRSTEANIQLAGDLTVSKTVESVLSPYRLDGTLRATRGTYRLTLGGATSKDFQVSRGEVRFFGTPDLNPQLDIVAEHPVRTVRGTDLTVRARIGGTLLEPRLALESDQRPPLSETEIVSYLLFGRPSFDLVGAATGTGSEQAVLAGAVVGLGLSVAAGQLAQTLAANLGLPLDYIAIHPGAAGDRLGSTRVEAGTQIGERTFLKLNAPLCEVRRGLSGQLLGASIEYRLNPRWRVEASLEPLLQECRAVGGAPRPSAPYQIGVDLFWQRGVQ